MKKEKDSWILITFFLVMLGIIVGIMIGEGERLSKIPKCSDKEISVRTYYYFGCVEECMKLNNISSYEEIFDNLCSELCLNRASIFAEEWIKQMYKVNKCYK